MSYSPFTLEIDLSGIALVQSILIIGVRLHMERQAHGQARSERRETPLKHHRV